MQEEVVSTWMGWIFDHGEEGSREDCGHKSAACGFPVQGVRAFLQSFVETADEQRNVRFDLKQVLHGDGTCVDAMHRALTQSSCNSSVGSKLHAM